MASSDPDRYYFALLSHGEAGCLSVQPPYGVQEARVSSDETRFYLLGGGGGLCVIEALPVPDNPPGWPH